MLGTPRTGRSADLWTFNQLKPLVFAAGRGILLLRGSVLNID